MDHMTRVHRLSQSQSPQRRIDTTSATNEAKASSAYPIINLLLPDNPCLWLELIQTVEITPQGSFQMTVLIEV